MPAADSPEFSGIMPLVGRLAIDRCPAVEAAPMFYRPTARATLRGAGGGRAPVAGLGWLAKWLGIRLPGSVDDPNVDSLIIPGAPAFCPPKRRGKFTPARGDRGNRSARRSATGSTTPASDRDLARRRTCTTSGRRCQAPRPHLASSPAARQYFFPMFLTRIPTAAAWCRRRAGGTFWPPGCREPARRRAFEPFRLHRRRPGGAFQTVSPGTARETRPGRGR